MTDEQRSMTPMTDEQRNMTPAEKERINAEVAAILRRARALGTIK